MFGDWVDINIIQPFPFNFYQHQTEQHWILFFWHQQFSQTLTNNNKLNVQLRSQCLVTELTLIFQQLHFQTPLPLLMQILLNSVLKRTLKCGRVSQNCKSELWHEKKKWYRRLTHSRRSIPILWTRWCSPELTRLRFLKRTKPCANFNIIPRFFYSYSYSYSMAINTAHPGYGLSCCHGSLLQIRLNGYKREGNVASQPAHEVVHTSLQHEQSSPQLQLLGATGWGPVPLSVASGFLSIVVK